MSEEVLYESGTTRVSRVTGWRGEPSVIRKEALGPGGARRTRHELAIMRRLAGIRGIPRIVETESGVAETALLEDTGETTLARQVSGGPLDVETLLSVGSELARIIAEMHRRGVIHGDVNPANIVVSGSPPRPTLIDFGLATSFPEEHPGFTHHNDIVGTPAYMAPEQTGRTGWPVDHRADLYGLGATLYELATGTPPFGTGDVLELIYDHLTREPAPVREVNPEVPAALSAVIAHLLEKEPDRRYQSADGVLHDLRSMLDTPAERWSSSFVPGLRDFPWRLVPPTRLVGRETEIALLSTAFAEAASEESGHGGAVLVSGRPGVGKTVLIDQLKPLAGGASGWFLTAKFDQYRRDIGSDGVQQMTGALARMLLAESDAELAALRARLRTALGANAGLVVAAVPEMRPVLDLEEDAVGDPLHAPLRLLRAGLDLLGTVAGPRRPLVVVFDDLQWADSLSLDFLDALLGSGPPDHVLVVGAYRETEVDAAHPLTTMVRGWRTREGHIRELRLDNLSPVDLEQLLADMLRLPVDRASTLAGAIERRTGGNPFDTVQLVNALRRDGTLSLGESGWTWDEAALADGLRSGDVVGLLASRIRALDSPTRAALAVMTCLSGEVGLDLLHAVFDHDAGVTVADATVAGMTVADATAVGPTPGPALTLTDAGNRLAPAIEDGLLVLEHGRTTSVRFRHDRVQQAAHGLLDDAERRSLHLALARRFAAEPAYRLVAAEQYLAVGEDLYESLTPDECRQATKLLWLAAGHARELGRHTEVDRCLTRAAGLLDRLDPAAAVPADERWRRELRIERHAALSALGRFERVDELYQIIKDGEEDPLRRARAAAVQVTSLLNRGRAKEALDLGLAALAELGHPAPAPEDLPAEIDRAHELLTAWAARPDADDDREVTADARAEVAGQIIHWSIAAAYFCIDPAMAWLVARAARLWEEHGPARGLIGPMAHSAFVTALREDYATGYAALRRVVRAAERRGYEPETSEARFLDVLSAAHWFEPIEDTVRRARLAREGLIRSGDLHNACFTYFATTPQLMDHAPTLDDMIDDVHAGLALAERINPLLVSALLAYRQAARTLAGETDEIGEPDDASFSEEEHLAGLAGNPNAAANYHMSRAVVALIFGDQAVLRRHSAALLRLLPFVLATSCVGTSHVLQALAAAGRLAEVSSEEGEAEREAVLAELDGCRDWIARRAAEAPGNFLHLRSLVDAERAWALGDHGTAAEAFAAARDQVAGLPRPWQRAFVTERYALLLLSRGEEAAGRTLLREAREQYRAWGAEGKVAQLDLDHEFLGDAEDPWVSAEARRSIDPRRGGSLSAENVDMLAVLRASQALSSETSLPRLQERVREVLNVLTGATSVHVLLRQDGGWRLMRSGDQGGGMVPAADAGDTLPLSVVRYVQRSGRPLTVDDATVDDRFARDPYLAGMDFCSIMVVPIVIRDALNGMLVLENRRGRGAFGPAPLDAVLLIAGQLSVSLQNALLYTDLEGKVAERTEALKEANERLELLAVTDPLTGLANRRRLTEVLRAEWSRSRRSGDPITVAMIDIDHFKRYNDAYGHLAGDECLRTIAELLARSVRDTDTCARYGGEEFALVLAGANADAADKIAERIRMAVEDLRLPNARADHRIVTVSIGVATATPWRFERAEQLIEAADTELYRAKQLGRNRVCSQEH